MTRINVIDPVDLTDQHLMAEYRELPMIMGSLRRSLKSKRGVDVSTIPSSYTLNTGHVRHFYNKGKWLHRRYYSLIDELRRRGYDINPDSRNVDWGVFGERLFLDWQPTPKDCKVNLERILIRVMQKPTFYTLNKKKITADEYSAQMNAIYSS